MKRVIVVAFVVSLIPIWREAQADKPLRIQVEPGANPERLAYAKDAVVHANGKRIGGTFSITNKQKDQRRILLQRLAPGDTLTVSATFGDQATPASCQRTWSAVRQDSIGCGPIQIRYQPTTNSCELVCR